MRIYSKVIQLVTIILFVTSAYAQPVNDNCSGAINIGTLPLPGGCIGGLQDGAPITLNNQSTVGATSPNPYVYQTACQGVGNMTPFALDTWYVFTASGTTVNVSITGFNNVEMAIYSGTCGNLLGFGCSTNGTMVINQIVAGQTYYMQISGNTNSATDNNFSINIDNDIDCNDCLTVSSLTASPQPVNGGYTPGQVVHFCYTVSNFNEINTNWFHGVQIAMGPGWTGIFSGLTPAADCNVDVTPGPGNAGAGIWSWYPGGVTSSANGSVWPAGFYFDNSNVAGNNAGNNFGDPGNCGWTFCWDLTVSSTCVNGSSLNVTVNTSGDGESGSWSSLGCVDDPSTVFAAVQLCCSATATNTGAYCVGGTIQLNGTGGGTYSWTGPNGFSSILQNPTLPATSAAAGVYTLTINNAGCISTAATTVVVNSVPTVSVNNATICAGQSTTLTATPSASGGTYLWNTGATTQSITVSPGSTTSYSVVYTLNGCVSLTVSGTVSVNPLPTVSVNSPTACSGSPATVTATPVPPGAYNYSWTVPGGATNPGNVANFNATVSGLYSVVITNPLTACSSSTSSGTVTINPLPTVSVNNTTICAGQSATLTATPSAIGGTYLWNTGATTQSITVSPGSTTSYSVVYTLNGCASLSVSGTVTVNPVPTVSVNNTTICSGQSATLTATPSAIGGTYLWNTGATTQSITISPGSTAAYSVVYTLNGCVSLSVSGTVSVNPLPTVSVNSPTACSGSPAAVIATTVLAGVYNYSWTGPGGATNPGNVANFNATISGLYSVIITNPLTGCSSSTSSGTVTINPLPTVSVNNATICAGQSATITATPSAIGGTYLWNTGAATQIITISPGSTTSYSVVYTLNGCASLSVSGTVSVNPLPTVSVNSPTACSGSPATFTATPVPAGVYDYSWTVPGGATNPGNVANFNATISGSYSVIITNPVTGCSSSTSSGTVTINPLPEATVNSPTVCSGTNASVVSTPGTPGTYSYSWTTPVGVTNPGDVASLVTSTAGTYSVILTNISTGCEGASASGIVTVNPIPAAPNAGTDTTYCSSWTTVAMTVTGAGGSYTWYSDIALTTFLGSGGSLLPNNGIGATVYYVTETLLGCEGPASFVTITIQDCDITVPTAFTPDGDGVNDYWEIVDLDNVSADNVVMVFNRWGTKLYESKPGNYASMPWDGRFNGDALPVGSYYFIIDFHSDKKDPINGIISIILE